MNPLRNLISHTIVAAAAAILAASATTIILTGQGDRMVLATAHAQPSGTKSTEVLTQTMPDIAREMRISVTERAARQCQLAAPASRASYVWLCARRDVRDSG